MVDQNQKFKLFIAQLAMNLGILLILLPLFASVIAIVADNGGLTAEGCSGECRPGLNRMCYSPAGSECSGSGCSCTEEITIFNDCPCGYHYNGQK